MPSHAVLLTATSNLEILGYRVHHVDVEADDVLGRGIDELHRRESRIRA